MAEKDNSPVPTNHPGLAGLEKAQPEAPTAQATPTQGSSWGLKALETVKRLHQDEEARKAVARRLF